MSSFEEKKPKLGREPDVAQIRKSSASPIGFAANILKLQQTIGNQAVTSMFESMTRIRGEGRPLSEDLRDDFETRFQADFSRVRIHTGGDAAESARAWNANAYTVGHDLVFDVGKFDAASKSGQNLLAHELAHVVQQSRGGGASSAFDSGGSLEQSAQNAAAQFTEGADAISVAGASSPGLARQEKPDIPIWKKVLNPLYQKALDVLPKPAAEKLEQLNEVARTLKDKNVITDDQLNAATKAAAPVIQPVQAILDTLRPDAPPNKSPEPVSSFGKLPASTPIARAREMKKQLEELKKADPNATMLDVPMPSDRNAPTAEDMLGFDPLQPWPEIELTEFEKKLQSKQPVTIEGETYKETFDPDKIVQVRNLRTGEILHYHTIKGATYYVLNREGRIVSTTGQEAPLQTPVIDPIDVVLFVADVGPLVAKGLTAGGKAISASIAKDALRETTEAAAGRTIGRTPAEAANELMGKYAGRLADSKDALAGIIERARHPSLRVEGRAAATELRGIIDVLEDGVGGRTASRVEVIPASNAGRTPDLVVHFADGTTTRYEMRTVTSAPRGHLSPKGDVGPGALARALAEATADRPVSRSQIAQAILDKAKVTPARPSQLTAIMPGVAPGGTISLNITAASTSTALVDDAVQSIAGRLGPHVERIEVKMLMPRTASTDALTRGTLQYVRQTSGAYIRVP